PRHRTDEVRPPKLVELDRDALPAAVTDPRLRAPTGARRSSAPRLSVDARRRAAGVAARDTLVCCVAGWLDHRACGGRRLERTGDYANDSTRPRWRMHADTPINTKG